MVGVHRVSHHQGVVVVRTYGIWADGCLTFTGTEAECEVAMKDIQGDYPESLVEMDVIPDGTSV